MALRALMKRRELDKANADMAELRKKAESFEQREAELEKAINEAETDEERSAVEDAVTSFEAERDQVNGEISGLEERISGIEAELEKLEAQQTTPAERGEETPKEPENNTHTKRGFEIMNKRNIFRHVPVATRAAMFERDDVKDFIGTVRTAMKEKRAIEGAGLLVPKVFLGVLRENIVDYSKLLKYVNLVQVSGEARQGVMGTIPEAVWTDCCGKLNELDLNFYADEVNCWKVAGFMAICNATLEDSDIDLASEILTALGYAIGYAIDKAIPFGLGTRMPLGFFTRLTQTTEPSDYSIDARPWVDLHTTNIKKIASNKTGAELFKEMLLASGNAKGKYSRGQKVWIMNDTTYATIKANAMTFDASGAIVAAVNNVMPVIGGNIEVLEFVPDNMIFGGYLDNYLMAERAGTKLATSEHVRFLDDQTVFKGTARYDGMPAIAEAFVAIGINGTDPSAESISFAPDVANSGDSE